MFLKKIYELIRLCIVVFEVKAKVWLELNSKCIVGEGRAKLLQKIKELSSLAKAARSMGMAYSHAWSEIREISNAAGSPVIITSKGGKNGGNSNLTELGEKILKKFKEENANLNRYISQRNQIPARRITQS
jgi:molybdate transport system regulatory protein